MQVSAGFVRWRYLDHNPADTADPPSQRITESARRRSIRFWTAEQIKRFEGFIAERSGQLYALWLLVALTGLRRSEALGVRWTDVDLTRRRISVRRVIVKVGSRAEIKEAPKSENGYRAIDIGPKLVDVLRARYPDHPTHRIGELIADSGLPRIRPLQDLRHTHASLLLAAGEPPKVVQERLGHPPSRSTYQHLLPGMGEAAARRFEELVLEHEEPESPS